MPQLSRPPGGVAEGPAGARADAAGATWHPSPNHGPRRGGVRADMVVLHHTAMASAGAALERLCAPEAQVSAHYLIGAGGELWQLVAEEARAWHAGAGEWAGVADVNSRSIGIELDNDGATPFAAAQILRLEGLLAGIMKRHAIPPERVIAHSDMAPARKVDPGPRLDWARLARLGLSVWPSGAAVAEAEAELRSLAPEALARAFGVAVRTFGYGLDPATPGPGPVLAAFRLRFRPGAEGEVALRDAALARVLAMRWPARSADRA